MEDFGIIVACCQRDYFFAKACCASIRHFLGDVPICLLIDGTFPVTSLERAYNVRVINHLSVTNQFLREKSFGWGKTKMIAFWESPWQHFLVLDADTNIWGNVLRYADFKNFDMIIDRPVYEYTDSSISKFFFDIRRMETHFPDFCWQKHRADFFCTGVFFGQRNTFSLDEYIEILDFHDRHPGLFKFGEMGYLNFMIFRAVDEGRIRIKQEDMQLLVWDFTRQQLSQRFPRQDSGPVVSGDEATVIHWAGPIKPTLYNSKVHSEPINFFRRKSVYETDGITGLAADVVLQWEDLRLFITVTPRNLRRWWKNKVKGMGNGKMGNG